MKEKISVAKSSKFEDATVGVSYKSNRTAMALGPTDQGATATLVCEFFKRL